MRCEYDCRKIQDTILGNYYGSKFEFFAEFSNTLIHSYQNRSHTFCFYKVTVLASVFLFNEFLSSCDIDL